MELVRSFFFLNRVIQSMEHSLPAVVAFVRDGLILPMINSGSKAIHECGGTGFGCEIK